MSFLHDDAKRREEPDVGSPEPGLHARFDDVHGEVHRADERTQHGTADEVLHQFGRALVVERKHALQVVPAEEEHDVAGSVAHENGGQAAVVLTHTVRAQVHERMTRVFQLFRVAAVLQQRLHAFERGQGRFHGSGEESRHGLRSRFPDLRTAVSEQSLEAVVHPEHQRQGRGFLEKRGDDPPVQVTQTFPLQLADGAEAGYSVQLLAKHGLVEGEGCSDVDERCPPSADELAVVVVVYCCLVHGWSFGHAGITSSLKFDRHRRAILR